MATRYHFRALNSQGLPVSSAREADNVEHLATLLLQQGWTLLRARRSFTASLGKRSGGIGRKRVIAFTYQLKQLLEAGISLDQALDELSQTGAKSALGASISRIRMAIDAGSTLSQAITAESRIFDPIYIAMLRVGEESGRLPEILDQLGKLLSDQDALARKARAVTIYPGTVLLVLICVLALLLGYLVPQLEPFLAGIGTDPSGQTQALLTTSRIWRTHWWLMFVPVAALCGSLLLTRLSGRCAMHAARLTLGVWGLGPLLLRIKLVRFATCLKLTYASGIHILDALRLCQPIVTNVALETEISDALKRAENGKSLHDSFAASPHFPRLFVRMIAVGEASGTLDHALANLATFYQRDIDAVIQRIEAIASPALILILAGLLIWIVIAVLGPVYDTALGMGAAF